MDRDKIARLLAELAKVGDIEKCRTCHCYVDVLRQVQEDILSRDHADLPEAEALDEMVGRAYAEQSHGCLGCDPCLPVEPFNAFNERLQKDTAQGSCRTPASAEARSVADLSPSWPPLPGDYTVLDKDASGAVCTLADEDLPESPADPAGYLVVDVYADKNIIRLEHHTPDHRVTAALIGSNARDLHLTVIRRGLVSRLDHAAYLGYELGKAERALMLKTRDVQDRPERIESGSRSVSGGKL